MPGIRVHLGLVHRVLLLLVLGLLVDVPLQFIFKQTLKDIKKMLVFLSFLGFVLGVFIRSQGKVVDVLIALLVLLILFLLLSTFPLIFLKPLLHLVDLLHLLALLLLILAFLCVLFLRAQGLIVEVAC